MAKKHTIDIDIKNNADETAKDFNTLNKSMDQTTKSAKNLDATFEEVYGELQPLTSRMGEAEDRLYELSLAGDTTSKEFQELLTRVGQYRKVQIQTDIAVDGAAKTMTEKLGSALTGATSGFALAQGSMALFGSENEALEKSLLKVQGAMAIQQGVKGLSDSYKELAIGTKLSAAAQWIYTTAVGTSTGAMKLFRLALISTGIGAIVVGLGLLVANFDKVSKFVKKAVSSFRELGPVMKIILWPITAAIAGFDLMKKGLQELGVIQTDAENKAEKRAAASRKRREALHEQYKKEQQLIQDSIDATRRVSKVKEDAINKEITLRKAAGKETRELEREKLKLELDTIRIVATAKIEAYKLEKKRGKDLFEFKKLFAQAGVKEVEKTEFELQVFDTETNKIKSDNYKTHAAERLSIARQIQDMEHSLLEDGIDKELEINKVKFERLIADMKGNSKEKAELKALLEKQELEAIQEIRQKYFDIEKAEAQELIDFVAEQNAAEVEANKAKNDKIIADNKAAREKDLEDEKAVSEAKNSIRDAQIANIEAGIALVKGLAGDNKKLQAAALIAENAVGIAKIIIQTQAANAAVTAKYALLPGGLALAAGAITANKISAGIGIASSIAATAKGLAALKSGGSAGGGSVGGGGAGGGGGEVSPEFNVVGDSGINQIAQLQASPTQAFVVSGEVTTSQALDRNRVQNATL